MKTISEQNRDDAYVYILPKLGARQQTVYNLIEFYKLLTISEIAQKMVLPPGSVSARITELTLKCLIRPIGSKISSNTNVKSTQWQIVPMGERKAIRDAKIAILSERAVHLSQDLDAVASSISREFIKKEIARTDKKLEILIKN